MDTAEEVLNVLAHFVPTETLALCDTLEEKTKHLNFFDRERVVANKLIEALREKCNA